MSSSQHDAANAARSQIASIQVRNRFTVELKATSQLSKSTLLIFTAQYSELQSWCKTRQNINSEVHQHSLWQWMQTYDYARAALWDTAIKVSLQSRAMTSRDRLDVCGRKNPFAFPPKDCAFFACWFSFTLRWNDRVLRSNSEAMRLIIIIIIIIIIIY